MSENNEASSTELRADDSRPLQSCPRLTVIPARSHGAEILALLRVRGFAGVARHSHAALGQQRNGRDRGRGSDQKQRQLQLQQEQEEKVSHRGECLRLLSVGCAAAWIGLMLAAGLVAWSVALVQRARFVAACLMEWTRAVTWRVFARLTVGMLSSLGESPDISAAAAATAKRSRQQAGEVAPTGGTVASPLVCLEPLLLCLRALRPPHRAAATSRHGGQAT